MTHVFMLPTNSPLAVLPDIRSYSLHFDWHLDKPADNGRLFDDFHAKHQDAARV